MIKGLIRIRSKRYFSIVSCPSILLMSLLLPAFSIADIKDDLAYTEMAAELGVSLPDGAAIAVLQVEAGTNFAPDSTQPQFAGKTFQDLSDPPSSASSGHATGVGSRFYGLTSSIAPSISDIAIYSANSFLFDFLNVGSSAIPQQLSSRVANHSWVGGYLVDNDGNDLPLSTSNVLRRLDWLIEDDEFVHVVAPNPGTEEKPLLTSAFNVITVGRSSGIHLTSVSAIDSVYVTNRSAIHLVVPQSSTSNSAPYASAAAVLMIDAAHANPAWSEGSTSNRSGAVIYNAERSETIKAALMAGASRFTYNSSTTANIEDYRVDTANQTDNGLDWRYGAGQLNINNSYKILAAGEQSSLQEGGDAILSLTGFDYAPRFGGRRGSDTVAEYNLATAGGNQFFTASLVWNLDVDGGSTFFSSLATLRNLDLYLVDTTAGANTVVASSLSSIDNTENVWFELIAGHDYQIRVESLGANFEWDYSLAWQAVDFTDSDGDGAFDHIDSDVQDPCAPNVFVSVCNADSDNDGLTDFAEGETLDTDGDGFLDYLESNILDDDGDGFANQVDIWNDDACMPDASQCTYDIPVLPMIGQVLLALGLVGVWRRRLS